MKKNLKRVFITMVAVVLCLTLVACSSNSNSDSTEKVNESNSEEQITIRFGSVYTMDSTYGQAVEKFKSDVESASNGAIKVDVFHGGVLGSEKDHIQSQKEGSIEILFSGTAGIGLFVPAMSVFESWFAFENLDQMKEAFISMYSEMDEACQEHGFKLLGAYFDGPRHILSNKKVENIEQLKGIKLRVPGSPIYVNMASALGAQAVSMPMGDVYTALQTNAVDAMEGTIDTIYQQKFHEQGKYLIKSGHVYSGLSITYNKDSWDKLSPEYQKIIQDAVTDSVEYQIKLQKENNDKTLQLIVDSGVQPVEITDRNKWVSAVKTLTKNTAESYGDLGIKIYNKILEYQSK